MYLKITMQLSFFIILVNLFIPCFLYAGGGCVYDSSAINKSYFIKNTKFKDAIWDNNLKEAKIIIDRGNYLIVKYFACQHFGTSAEYLVTSSDISSNFIKGKIKWLADKLLDESDYKLLIEALDKEGFIKDIKKNNKIFLTIDGSDYIEFLISIKRIATNKLTIHLSWYF